MRKYTKEQRINKFWERVDKSGGIDSRRNWTAGCDRYGRTNRMGKDEWSHRVAYVLAYGEIPDGLLICHKCDNPLCCNPKHLFLGTHADNAQDMVRKGRANSGEKAWNCKLTDAQVAEIRLRYSEGDILQYQLAIEYSVSRAHISAIIRFKIRV